MLLFPAAPVRLLAALAIHQVAFELVDGTVEEFLHGVVCLQHEGVQLPAHRVGVRLRILGGVIARPLPAQNLHWGSWLLLPPISRLLAESLSRLDWSGVELGEGILISIPGPTSHCCLCCLTDLAFGLNLLELGVGDGVLTAGIAMLGVHSQVFLKVTHDN